MYVRFYKYSKSQSFFLFGPRGVGKSTWLKKEFKEAYYIDLLDQALYLDYLRHPEKFKDHILASEKKWVIVDEVQRLPELLNYVHQLIEEKKIKFVLTGSSARKLKAKGVNLLAGRALNKRFSPLTVEELARDFDLKKSLMYGHLPLAQTSPEPKKYLKSYISIYLREEVQQEALVRNLTGFAQFLEALAFSQGQVISVVSLAADVGIDRRTTEAYLQILEDLLLAHRIPVFQKKAKRRMALKPKFYFFDVGVYRELRKRGPLDSDNEIDGAALETLCLQELKAHIVNYDLDAEVFFYRTQLKEEVDFVVYGQDAFFGLEVKKADRIREDDLKNLILFKTDYPQAKAYLFYSGAEERVTKEGIMIMPIEKGLRNIKKLFLGN